MAEKSKYPTADGRLKSFAYRSKTDPVQHMVIIPLTEDAQEPEQIIEERGVEYERVDCIKIDVNQIPDRVRDSLVEATFKAYKEFIKVPGNLKKLKRRIAEKERAAKIKKGG